MLELLSSSGRMHLFEKEEFLGAIPGSAQGFLLVVLSGITPGGTLELYGGVRN